MGGQVRVTLLSSYKSRDPEKGQRVTIYLVLFSVSEKILAQRMVYFMRTSGRLGRTGGSDCTIGLPDTY
jgi:hypothetical protein